MTVKSAMINTASTCTASFTIINKPYPHAALATSNNNVRTVTTHNKAGETNALISEKEKRI